MRRVLALVALTLSTVAVVTLPAGAVARSSVPLPTASGGFGQSPKISFPTAKPPSNLASSLIRHGTGSVVNKGDLMVANYFGQIWDGKVFASSYAQGETAAFAIGEGQVIPAWDKTLVGARVGSRVLIVAPPGDAYGATGSTGAGIKPNTTLVFVVDVVAAYTKSIGTNVQAQQVTTTAKGITVSGRVGALPTAKVATGTPKPTAQTFTLLDKGHGSNAKPGMVILQYALFDWTGKLLESTWKLGTPYGEYIGNPKAKSPFDSFVGLPIGSRALMTLPADSSGGPYALVVELAAEVPRSSSN